jgi:tetratricopeptide (TPR) repeat protein
MNNLGLSLARSGLNLDEALKLVNDSLAISGPMTEVLDSRALVYIARQEPEKALEDLAAAIQDDGAAEQYFHQAWAYSLAGNKTEASIAFAAAMKKGLDPKDLDPRECLVYDRLKVEL